MWYISFFVSLLIIFPQLFLIASACNIPSSISCENRHTLLDKIDSTYNWELVDIYAEAKSGRAISFRPEFQRMISDCKEGKIDLILTKSIERFGRNTVDTLQTIQLLRSLDVDLLFEIQNIKISENSNDFLLSVMQAFAEAESRSKSEIMKMSFKQKFEDGTSKLYNRKCFGYSHDDKGFLVVNPIEADVVKTIFNLYLDGHSLLSIIRYLESNNILTPRGKNKWHKDTIDHILINEKYIGDVRVQKSFGKSYPNTTRLINQGQLNCYLMSSAHAPIISKEIFEEVQKEKLRRCNTTTIDNVKVRKSTHYSMKSRKP
ncbi:MAG: recombinase family protein [Clostridium sp.]